MDKPSLIPDFKALYAEGLLIRFEYSRCFCNQRAVVPLVQIHDVLNPAHADQETARLGDLDCSCGRDDL